MKLLPARLLTLLCKANSTARKLIWLTPSLLTKPLTTLWASASMVSNPTSPMKSLLAKLWQPQTRPRKLNRTVA